MPYKSSWREILGMEERLNQISRCMAELDVLYAAWRKANLMPEFLGISLGIADWMEELRTLLYRNRDLQP